MVSAAYDVIGVAVTGDAAALPVSRFTSSSPVWREIVGTFAAEFARAEREDEQRSHRNRPTPGPASLTRQLQASEVDVWVAAGTAEYVYFNGRRQVVRDSTCIVEKYYRGLLVRKGGRLRKIWMGVSDDGCDGPSQVVEIIGGVRIQGKDWLVVQNWGDDWQDFDVIDPSDPKSEFGGVFKKPEGGSRKLEAGS